MRFSPFIFLALAVQAAEPWRLDVGSFLQFPIPAGTTYLADRFTPIIGGGGDFHWWFSDKIGAGVKSTADYLTDMDLKIDQIELTQLAQVNYRFSFSDKSFASFGLETGVTAHLYRARADSLDVNRSGPVVGGFVALPVRVQDHWVVGPHAETLIQFFKEDSGDWGRPEWYVAIGVTGSFIMDFQ